MKDYYEILHCSPADDVSVIRRAWTFRMAQLNPRLNARSADHAATKEAQDVNEAWSVLSDSAHRAEYDRTWRSTREESERRARAESDAKANAEAEERAESEARARAESMS